MSMKRREFLKKAGGSAAGVSALWACGGPGSDGPIDDAGIEGPRISWRMQTSFTPNLDLLHGSGTRIAERVEALTGGNFTMRVYGAGEIVPGLQVMDAVQQGTVQAGHTASYYYVGKNPALAFDSAVPFGLTARQQTAWLFHGGGMGMLREVLSDFNIIHFPCGNTGVQMGGWFRRPIASLADLRGLRMRIPGVAGQVMTRLGVNVQVLAGGDIFPALERGAIDATEFVGPYDDEKLGFYQVAQHYYYPGWAEPNVSPALYVNQRAWDQLPTAYQQVIEAVTRETHDEILARYDAENPPALERLVNDHGVLLQRFPDDVMQAGWQASNDVLEQYAAEDGTFDRIYRAWKNFRRRTFAYFRANELAYYNFAFAERA